MRGGSASADAGRRRCRTLRTDAVRNRTKILTAAQELLVEQGWEAPLDDIARRAGVGNATVYRHFRDREGLLAEAVESIVMNIADAAERATATNDDPYVALRHFLQTAAHERLAALCCLSDETVAVRPELARQKNRLMHAAHHLLNRAKQAEQVRADVSLEEILAAVAQLGRPLPGTSWSATDQFSARTQRLYLDGLLAPAPSRSDLPPDSRDLGAIGPTR